MGGALLAMEGAASGSLLIFIHPSVGIPLQLTLCFRARDVFVQPWLGRAPGLSRCEAQLALVLKKNCLSVASLQWLLTSS